LILAVIGLARDRKRCTLDGLRVTSVVPRKGGNNVTMLTTLNIVDPSTAIKVEVTVDREEYKARGTSEDSNRYRLGSIVEEDEAFSQKFRNIYGIAS
jgi:hypothetical protein